MSDVLKPTVKVKLKTVGDESYSIITFDGIEIGFLMTEIEAQAVKEFVQYLIDHDWDLYKVYKPEG